MATCMMYRLPAARLGFLSVPVAAVAGAVVYNNNASPQPMTDPSTGITFDGRTKNNNGLEIYGVGTRWRGPFKVYSVAMYGPTELKEKLSTISIKNDKQVAYDTLNNGVKNPNVNATFVLQMTFKVSAEKMASAISDSVIPRHTGPVSDIDQLRSNLTNGLGTNGAPKGTTLQFDCTNTSVDITINGTTQSTVQSYTLGKAFVDVYLDNNCVSTTLRDSCIKNCCSP